MRIKGELPSLNVLVSDKRLEEILCLVNSIPFPESAPPPPEEVLATWEVMLHSQLQQNTASSS